MVSDYGKCLTTEENKMTPAYEFKIGYTKRVRVPEIIYLRTITIEEIPYMRHGQEYWFIGNDGFAYRCRVSSSVKKWKTYPNRYEVSFKYGLYENWRWNTMQIIDGIFIKRA